MPSISIWPIWLPRRWETMWRSIGPAHWAALFACVWATGCGAEASPKRPDPPARTGPNVLLIVLDTTRRDRLSCYGYERPTTPNLDRIAAEGALYENCITPGSWTSPSHATLFTGLYPRDHNTNCGNLVLAEHFTTLADVLTESGYQTVGFSNNAWLGQSSGLQQGFSEFFDIWIEQRRPEHRHFDAGAKLTNERVLGWLDDHRVRNRPFFIFINYLEPHLPYRPPRPYEQAFLPENTDLAMVAHIRAWEHPREVRYILKEPGMDVSPEQFEILKALYDGEIAYLDSQLGTLFDGLRARGLLDNTILLVTSDHGEHLGEHGLMDHKMSLYDVLIHVPLIVRYPPAVPRGTRVQAHVQMNDVFPTILSLCEVKLDPPKGSHPLPFQDGEGIGRSYTFAEFDRPTIFLNVMNKAFPNADTRRFDCSLTAIRGHRYKYIWASDGRSELYDIADDPQESRNLADSHPQVVEQLHELLLAFQKGEQPSEPIRKGIAVRDASSTTHSPLP